MPIVEWITSKCLQWNWNIMLKEMLFFPWKRDRHSGCSCHLWCPHSISVISTHGYAIFHQFYGSGHVQEMGEVSGHQSYMWETMAETQLLNSAWPKSGCNCHSGCAPENGSSLHQTFNNNSNNNNHHNNKLKTSGMDDSTWWLKLHSITSIGSSLNLHSVKVFVRLKYSSTEKWKEQQLTGDKGSKIWETVAFKLPNFIWNEDKL